MLIPNGMTEAQVLAAIDKVVKSLAKKFRFGFFDNQDMEQQAALFAIELINSGKFNPEIRPLENFLYTHVRNRLINFKRDKFKRSEPPCITCPFYDKLCKRSTNQCAEFENKMDCSKYASWVKRNETKRGLMNLVDINSVFDENSNISLNSYTVRDVEYRELIENIERRMVDSPVKHLWEKVKNSVKLKKKERLVLQHEIMDLIKEEKNE